MHCSIIILFILIPLSIQSDDTTGIEFVTWLNKEWDKNVYPDSKDIFLRERDGENIFDRENTHPQIVLEQFVSKLNKLFRDMERSVRDIKDVVERDYRQNKSRRRKNKCCNLNKDKSSYNAACDIIAPLSGDAWLPSEDVTRVMVRNHKTRGIINSQYFGSSEGAFVLFPEDKMNNCNRFDPRLRPWYRDAMKMFIKHVVIVIDTSSSMAIPSPIDSDNSTLSIVKNAVNKVIDMLSREDKVSVVATSNNVQTPSGVAGDDNCFKQHLGAASSTNKAHLKHFIGNLMPRGSFNIWKGLEAAIKLIASNKQDGDIANVVLLVTNGHRSPKMSNKSNEIQEKIKTLDITVMPYVVAETLNQKYEALLKNLSTRPETFHHITNSSYLEVNMSTFYSKASCKDAYLYLQSRTKISFPYRDYSSLRQIVSVCQAVVSNVGVPIGVVCTEVPLLNITSIIDFPGSPDTSTDHYVFLMNMYGNMIHHPLLYYDDTLSSGNLKVNLDQVECQPQDSNKLLDELKRRKTNIQSCTKRIIPHGSLEDGMRLEEKRSKYWCSSLDVASYQSLYVCLVQAADKVLDSSYRLVKTKNETGTAMFGHDDLEFTSRQSKQRCNNVGQISSTEYVSFTYTHRAFKDPFKHISITTKQQRIEETMSIERELYNDVPENEALLKAGVKNTTLYLMNFLGKWLRHPEEKNPFLWRYICVDNGMLAIHPAVPLPKYYDCTARPWYRRSVAYPNLMLATPYIWGKKNRYLITISAQLFIKPRGYPVGVLGGDVTPEYFQTALINNVPHCKEPKIDCMLMDNQGNMVAHQHLVSYCNSTFEKVHITSKEPALAYDLIQKNMLKQKSCVDLMSSRVYQWFDFELHVRGQPYESHSGGYRIVQLTFTNLYLILKNTSVSVNRLYCGVCSSKLFNSRKSEKCLHKSKSECECPCYRDDDNFNFCSADYDTKRFKLPLCATRGQETLDSFDFDEYRKNLETQQLQKLKACFNEKGTQCDETNA